MPATNPTKQVSVAELVEQAREEVQRATDQGAGYKELFGNVLRSKSWLRAQRAVGLHMGFFAFFPPDHTALHYQTGSFARAQNQDFALPFLQAGARRELELLVEPPAPGAAGQKTPLVLSDCFWYARQAEVTSSDEQPTPNGGDQRPTADLLPRFARDLRHRVPPTLSPPLSPQEAERQIIFAPCGEMTACLIGWLLRRVMHRLEDDPTTIRALRNDPRRPWPTDGHQLGDDHLQKILRGQAGVWTAEQELPSATLPLLDPESPLNAPLCGHSDWAYRLGLIESEREMTPTPRLYHLLAWLVAYGDFCIAGEVGEHAASSFTPGLFAEDPLFDPSMYKEVRPHLNEARNALQDGNGSQIDVSALLGLIARLLLSRLNEEGKTSGDEWPLRAWRLRMRFVAAPHMLLRLEEHYERSWLVYPIAHIKALDADTKWENVGFFLGTLRAVDPDSGRFEAYPLNPWYIDEARSAQLSLIRRLLKPVEEWVKTEFYYARIYRSSFHARPTQDLLGGVYHHLDKAKGELEKGDSAAALRWILPWHGILGLLQKLLGTEGLTLVSDDLDIMELARKHGARTEGPTTLDRRLAGVAIYVYALLELLLQDAELYGTLGTRLLRRTDREREVIYEVRNMVEKPEAAKAWLEKGRWEGSSLEKASQLCTTLGWVYDRELDGNEWIVRVRIGL